MTRKPRSLFDELYRSYTIGAVAGLAVVAAMFLAAKGQRQEWFISTLKNSYVLTAAINTFSIVAFLAALPGRFELFRFLAAYAVPGLGHWLMGRRRKAVFFFASIVAIYVTGLALTSFRMVGREDNPFYWYGQFFSGFAAVAAALLPSGKAHLPEGWAYTHFDPGLLYVCAAALLNYVVSLNVFDKHEEPAPAPPPASSTEAAT
jgi:hypothetical protein